MVKSSIASSKSTQWSSRRNKSSVVAVADAIDAMRGLSVAGVTSFPTQLYDLKGRMVKPTPNLRTLEKAAEALQAAGRKGIEINAPGVDFGFNMGLKDVEKSKALREMKSRYIFGFN